MPTAAIIIHDGYTDCEFLVAYHMLKAEGFDVAVYSLNGGPVTGAMGWVHKAMMSSGVITRLLGETDYEADILVLIGGVKAMEHLRQCKRLVKWVRRHDGAGKLIASVCHGSQLLIEADIVRGRRVLGYYSIRRDLENAGAIWPEGQDVCADGNIVSASHYNFAGVWMREVLRVWRETSKIAS